MKFKNFQKLEMKEVSMAQISGGTTTTVYSQVGYAENEYEDWNGNGKLDKDEAEGQTPILVEFPDN